METCQFNAVHISHLFIHVVLAGSTASPAPTQLLLTMRGLTAGVIFLHLSTAASGAGAGDPSDCWHHYRRRAPRPQPGPVSAAVPVHLLLIRQRRPGPQLKSTVHLLRICQQLLRLLHWEYWLQNLRRKHNSRLEWKCEDVIPNIFLSFILWCGHWNKSLFFLRIWSLYTFIFILVPAPNSSLVYLVDAF